MHTIQMEEVTFAARVHASPRRVRFEKTHQRQAVPQWQIEALEEYEESLIPLEVRLRHDLAARVLALTGHRVAPDAIYADAVSQVAVTTVDGIIFKLVKENLVILRSCVQCGCCQFTSMPITNKAELGYVLGEWEPRCLSCQEEDSIYWMYTD